MNRVLSYLPLTLLLSCSQPEKNTGVDNTLFAEELAELKTYFGIPGMAVLVQQDGKTLYEDYLGLASIEGNIPMDSSITIPVASLTKVFAAVLIMQLAEEGKLSLKDPVIDYLEDVDLTESIRIEHLLSHTSQGTPGKNFYYSNNRFMLLGRIIEKVSSQDFKTNIDGRIIEPLGLKSTYLLEDSAQLARENRKIAAPYFLGGEPKDGYQEKIVMDGFIDYGYSAAAGIASTVRDLARFGNALSSEELVNSESKDAMFTPFQPGLPYGLGVFSQEFMGEKLVWGYGQYDCYSSLLLAVPEKKLMLVLAANNNLMSDPARLIAGDVGYSLFALSFLKHFVLDMDVPLFEDMASLELIDDQLNEENSAFYRKKLLAQAIAASFMARFDEQEVSKSKSILRKVFSLYPDYTEYGDLVVMRNINVLKFMDAFRDHGLYSELDKQFLGVGKILTTQDPYNPYANYYLANHYDLNGKTDSAFYHYQQIVTASNFAPWWYTREAEIWMQTFEMGQKTDFNKM